jgi:hypothetical protein
MFTNPLLELSTIAVAAKIGKLTKQGFATFRDNTVSYESAHQNAERAWSQEYAIRRWPRELGRHVAIAGLALLNIFLVPEFAALVIEPSNPCLSAIDRPVYGLPSLREFHSGNGDQFPLRTNGAQ